MRVCWYKTISIAICAGTLPFLGGCAYHHKIPLAKAGYVNPHKLPKTGAKTTLTPIRKDALREAATTLGARGALAFRSRHIDEQLKKQSDYLNQIFNFNRLLLTNNVLPPVLVQANDSINVDNSDTIRTAQKVYKIISKARFVSTAPTWRDYLWLSYKKPNLPSSALLPRNQKEADFWNKYFKIGWAKGLVQANDIFADNLNRLKRDYLGMLLYRKLLAEGMISSPKIAKADLGVTGNANELRIHDEVARITAHSALQPDSQKWKPILTK